MADCAVCGAPLSLFVRKVQVVVARARAEYEFATINILAMPDLFVERLRTA